MFCIMQTHASMYMADVYTQSCVCMKYIHAHTEACTGQADVCVHAAQDRCMESNRGNSQTPRQA